jgi:hypothetical protein
MYQVPAATTYASMHSLQQASPPWDKNPYKSTKKLLKSYKSTKKFIQAKIKKRKFIQAVLNK